MKIVIALLALMMLAGCNNQDGFVKVKALNDQILHNDILLNCVKEETGSTCFSSFDRQADLRELKVKEIEYHSEVNQLMDTLDFCIAYKLEHASGDGFYLIYLYVGAEKYRRKYQSYEQYIDGSVGFQSIDSLWSINKINP